MKNIREKNLTEDEEWELKHPGARKVDEIIADARERAGVESGKKIVDQDDLGKVKEK